MDSVLSEQLIENLFYKGSPLHDGAVIIRNDRIFAAGCVLPLTENNNLSKDLGTRHRAGIGITEVSDAVVLIVSEETGIISMAVDGKLSRFLDLKTVEKTLLSHYMSKLTRRKAGTNLVARFFGKGRNG
jgi:diadenylate cyclase